MILEAQMKYTNYYSQGCCQDLNHHFTPPTPHFYRSFYVYKYATSFICAIRIANRLLDDKSFAKKYLKMLSSGCAYDPISILKIADCDLTKPQTFDESFSVCREFIKMWNDIL